MKVCAHHVILRNHRQDYAHSPLTQPSVASAMFAEVGAGYETSLGPTYNEAPGAGRKNVGPATVVLIAQDSSNEIVLTQMLVNGIHSLCCVIVRVNLCSILYRNMAFDSDHDRDSDNLSSTIRLSLQHIGKADINILPQQQQALSFVLSGRDTVVNLATGFGKSLVFELIPLCFDLKRRQPLWSSRVVIVSPLILLMESQVKDMQRRGLKAVRLSAETELSQAVTDATHTSEENFCSAHQSLEILFASIHGKITLP